MAAEISVSGVVAPPITSGRTRRHRFLFLAHLKAGADFEPVFWNRSQLFLCGKRKNWFQNWNQPRTSTGPALVEKGYRRVIHGSLWSTIPHTYIYLQVMCSLLHSPLVMSFPHFISLILIGYVLLAF